MTISYGRITDGIYDRLLSIVVSIYLVSTPLALKADDTKVLTHLENLVITEQLYFTELIQNAFFMNPQESQGILSFNTATGVLTKSVLEPDPVTMTVSADNVTIVEADQTRNLDLSANSLLFELAGAFRSLLLADHEALLEHFSIRLEVQNASGWSMLFTPTSEDLAKHIESLTVVASDNQIQSILTAFNNGDWQKLTIISDSNDDSSTQSSGDGG